MATPNPSIDDWLKRLKNLKAEKNYDQLLAEARKAFIEYPENKRILDLLHYAQEHYVKEKLDSQIVKKLVETKDDMALIAIYKKLLSILPNSNDLQKRLKKAEEHLAQKHRDDMQAYYKTAEEKICKLLREKKYEDANRACDEILEKDPGNKIFIHLLVKAEQGLDEEMNRKLEEYYREVIPLLDKEYHANKKAFIKL